MRQKKVYAVKIRHEDMSTIRGLCEGALQSTPDKPVYLAAQRLVLEICKQLGKAPPPLDEWGGDD